jgi:hypothetical protein
MSDKLQFVAKLQQAKLVGHQTASLPGFTSPYFSLTMVNNKQAEARRLGKNCY